VIRFTHNVLMLLASTQAEKDTNHFLVLS